MQPDAEASGTRDQVAWIPLATPTPARLQHRMGPHRFTSNRTFRPSGSSQNAPPLSRARTRFGSVIGHSPCRPLQEPRLDVACSVNRSRPSTTFASGWKKNPQEPWRHRRTYPLPLATRWGGSEKNPGSVMEIPGPKRNEAQPQRSSVASHSHSGRFMRSTLPEAEAHRAPPSWPAGGPWNGHPRQDHSPVVNGRRSLGASVLCPAGFCAAGITSLS